ncbi:MAG: RDD family protein [Bacteroidales bacterium]|nr:RDD family protein [Bacteroidales bacterium]
MKIVRIGRSNQNDIVIDDQQVSRNHLHIIQDDNSKFQVLDVGSKNGTFVNGNKIKSAFIGQNDIIRIGNSVIPWRNYFPLEQKSNNDNKPIEFKYAGFWLRFLAYFIDSIILGIIFTILYAIIGAMMYLQLYLFLPFVIPSLFLSSWLYFSIFESSKSQATVGKMALSIKVTDEKGNRILFGKATGRYFGKIISVIILYFGFFMAGWTEKKQALHDIMANTLVIKSEN